MASSARSSSRSLIVLCRAGSLARIRLQSCSMAVSPSTSGATAQNASTMVGSSCLPRRSRATAMAASTPAVRWKTSTVSARWNSRIENAIALPLISLGTPWPSQRVNICCSGSQTSAPRPSRSAICAVVRQCEIRPRLIPPPPVPMRLAASRSRWIPELPVPTCRSMNPSMGSPVKSTW